MRLLALTASIVFLGTASEFSSAQPGDPPGPAKETVELPDLKVWNEKQELALRFIKAGLEADRSMRYEDRNKPYCWFDKATGSHQTYLYCGLNRSLNASSRYWQSYLNPRTSGMPAPGTLRNRRNVVRSAIPVKRGAVEEMVARLGPSEFNQEIVARGLRGEPLPDNVPTEAEVDRFARALARIKELRDEYDDAQAELIDAIRDAGLTVERYNQISDLVERYDSLREMVRQRM